MQSRFDRRTVLKAGAAFAATSVIPAWAQDKPKLRFAAVFSDKDIRADMIRMHTYESLVAATRLRWFY